MREAAIAELIGKGLSNPMIAERLGLSTKTVANYVSTILLRLGAQNRLEAAKIVRQWHDQQQCAPKPGAVASSGWRNGRSGTPDRVRAVAEQVRRCRSRPEGTGAGAYYPAEMSIAPQSTLTVPVSADDHVRGPVAAPVTLVEYGDYECPYCAAARPVLAELIDHSRGEVRLVFRNFPLADVHPFALTAALAAEAAAALGAFWPMHDLLFSKQDRLRDRDLAGYARLLGLPADAVIRDAAQPYGDKIEADFRSGVDSGVRGTPTLFINGRRYAGRVDFPSLRAAVSSLTG
jgi:protein-disulfide isomerase/DNA-binding CsgD family transcriptional regulator